MHTEDVALFNDPPYNTGEDKIIWLEYQPTFISQGGYSFIHLCRECNTICSFR